ncbi:MAG: hypothetical protein IPK53_10880 [bacterium]|nr:hypothetical protein [bacterium]
MKFNAGDYARVRNLQFLLVWLAKYYGALFDILIVEQGAYSSLATHIPVLPEGFAISFSYNPGDYNRGWGCNVAVKDYCSRRRSRGVDGYGRSDGNGFVESVLACHGDLSAVSPYRNIYYCDERETELVQQTFSYDSLQRSNGVKILAPHRAVLSSSRRACF